MSWVSVGVLVCVCCSFVVLDRVSGFLLVGILLTIFRKRRTNSKHTQENINGNPGNKENTKNDDKENQYALANTALALISVSK